ncbi:MAG: ABC-2 family transporter protein, partial [bacterium]|nr:ABC-2 family transporter protein [bacterium]
FNDLMLLFALPATGFGLAETVFGNHRRLSKLIAEGGLDGYLTLPRDVLLSVITARTNVSAIGDCIFGAGLFFLIQELSTYRVAIYLFGSVTAALIWVSFSVLVSSLSFLFGNVEIFAGQVSNALITFSLYPPKIFQGLTRVLLYTAIPAGFLCYLPVSLVYRFNWNVLAAILAFTGGIMFVSRLVFSIGLKKYESGNLLVLKM